MPIQTVNGTDFYNYEIKDAHIVDQDSNLNLGSKAPSMRFQDYSSLVRQRKKQGKCKRFRKFLYNKENKTSCNRDGKHWGALIFYFAFFLGILFILFFSYFYGINRTMASLASTDRLLPIERKFYMSATPTFTFVPLTVNDYTHPFVWYKMSGANSAKNRRTEPYVAAIRQYYKTQATICAKNKMDACAVDPSLYGPCGKDTFGYNEQQPCLLLKLNSRSGWRPDAYHAMHKVPATMPKELKDNLDLNRETLCIYCEGASAHDAGKIGKVTYYPEPCYNDSFFPFSEGPIDVNPTIAIQLKPKPGYIVELSCRIFGLDADGTGEHQQSVFVYIGEK